MQALKTLLENSLSLIRTSVPSQKERCRVVLLGIVVIICWLGLIPVAQAAPCHAVNDRTICIVEIKRSAKYPWEYRVILSQDGVKQPQALYNCRDRIRIDSGGMAVPFVPDGNGDWICRLVKR